MALVLVRLQGHRDCQFCAGIGAGVDAHVDASQLLQVQVQVWVKKQAQ